MRVMEMHAPVKTVKRSQGRSATAAAAYRAAVRIEDERTGRVHDYTRKQGVEATAMLFPDEAPEWANDRSRLWNEAERRENRKDSQTAREIEVSFPHEFSAEHRQQAGLKIGQWIVMRYGSAVDLAWHAPSREGDQRNHHAHMLFTVRRFENGEWAAKKDNALDNPKTSSEELKTFRAAVSNVLNDIAARANLNVYVEHMSFKDRGLDREATQHMGPTATEMEREGQKTDIGQKNDDIRARNEERDEFYRESNVIDIDEGRKRMEEKNRIPSHPDYWRAFYQQTTVERKSMLDELDSQHGQQEKEMREEMAALHQSIDDKRRFVRFWRKITGRTAAEKERLAKIASAYDAIQEKRQFAQEAFENNRQEQMQALKQEELFQADETAPTPAEDSKADADEGIPQEAISDHVEIEQEPISERDAQIAELERRQNARSRQRGMEI